MSHCEWWDRERVGGTLSDSSLFFGSLSAGWDSEREPASGLGEKAGLEL
jgi:hypothetical protein